MVLVPLKAVDVGGGLSRERMMGSMGLGCGVGLVGYRVQWVVAVVERPAHRYPTCWPVVVTQMGRGCHCIFIKEVFKKIY